MQIRTDEIARTVDDNYYSRFLIIKMNNIERKEKDFCSYLQIGRR